MAISNKRLSNILFLDIETAGIVESFKQLDPELQKFWTIKAKQISRNKDLDQEGVSAMYHDKSGIYSEYAKVVCISVGFFVIKKGEIVGFRSKSFYGDDETQLLEEFITLLKEYFDQPKQQFICGHNIREFDIPFLCRRMIINRLKVPKMLDIAGKKPWQVEQLIDTLEQWRFGDYKHYISLALMAHLLDVPTPKDDIDGSMVHQTFWAEKDIKRIVKYCEKDVLTVAKVLLKLNLKELPEPFVVSSQTE